MTRILLALSLVVAMFGPALAQNKDVQSVIAGQIEAFKADDFATAFTFASPFIRGIFETPERFGMMVRQGYPMVWRPADVEFLDQDADGPFINQRIRIRDENGAYFALEYQMVSTPDGWLINGVKFIEDPSLSA